MESTGDTDKFLAVHFPHLRKSWLRKINDRLGLFKADKKNGGNIEISARFKNGRDEWTKWSGIDYSEPGS
jgi:hypothetical protein